MHTRLAPPCAHMLGATSGEDMSLTGVTGGLSFLCVVPAYTVV
jgi:hypothetical protein